MSNTIILYYRMENIIIDLKLRIQELEKENIALKAKMILMYSNWNYDYNRFAELKERCMKNKNVVIKTENIKTTDDITDDDDSATKK